MSRIRGSSDFAINNDRLQVNYSKFTTAGNPLPSLRRSEQIWLTYRKELAIRTIGEEFLRDNTYFQCPVNGQLKRCESRLCSHIFVIIADAINDAISRGKEQLRRQVPVDTYVYWFENFLCHSCDQIGPSEYLVGEQLSFDG